jgi:carbamoyl-phosphate synthase large subunit
MKNFKIYSTEHTAEEFLKNKIECSILHKVSERKKPNILDYIINKEIKLVINIPRLNGDVKSKKIFKDEYLIRRKAVEFGIPVVTNLEIAKTLINALEKQGIE